MPSERWQQIESVYHVVRALPVAERGAAVAELCAGDEGLRREIESLLLHEGAASAFMETPATAAVAATAQTLVGRRFGPYVIQSPLGAGGMGEVYRARDVQLGRGVAFKVLPQLFSSDPERLARFEREARLLAALNHPHIGAIYGLERVDGAPALVLELVEGETLAQRIAKGPLPLPDALPIALQIAEALEAAHAQGVVHRDLKPANIKVTPSGQVKVLDFGLAKAVPSEGDGNLSHSPTMTISATEQGVILGTAAYMSPEQARGQAVDKRSDVWAFGCVLFEMLSGGVAFGGQTVSDILAAVIKTAPDWKSLPAELPPRILFLLERCLEKHAPDRCQSMAEARLEIRKTLVDTGAAPAASVPPPEANARSSAPSDAQLIAGLMNRHRRGAVLVIAALLVAVVAGLYAIATGNRPTASNTSLQDLKIEQLTTSGKAAGPAISRDGQFVVYIERGEAGQGDGLWVRQTGTSAKRLLVGPQPGVLIGGATVTPDGRFVDFVRIVSRGAGGGTGSDDPPMALSRVDALAGSPRRLVDHVHSAVGWKPDGTLMAFVRWNAGSNTTSIVIADAEGQNEHVLVTQDSRSPQFSRLPLLGAGVGPSWSLDGQVIAMTGLANSDAESAAFLMFVSVSDGSVKRGPPGADGFAWLDSDSLVMLRGAPGHRQLWRVSYPDGAAAQMTNDVSGFSGLSLTTDRRALVTDRREVRGTIWIGEADASRGVEEAYPVADELPLNNGDKLTWVGRKLIFAARGSSLWSVPSSGAAAEEVLPNAMSPASSSDGRTLVYLSTNVDEPGSLWKADADGGNAVRLAGGNPLWPRIALGDRFVLYAGASLRPSLLPLAGGLPSPIADVYAWVADISPDGKRLAFVNYGGGAHVVVCELPRCSSRRTLTALRRRSTIRWTPDGAVAYASVEPGDNIYVKRLDDSPPQPLTRFTDHTSIFDFVWSHDGKRLAILRATEANDIVLIKGLKPGS
jgi:serine/threonine protein kinase/Tol biopolymer transport system component